MEAIERERQQLQRLTTRRLGLDTPTPNLSVGEMRSFGLEGDLENLPDIGEPNLLQDPTTGALYFVAGISAAGSSDMLM